MNNGNFTAFDVETATPLSNSICQIGIVKVHNSIMTEKFMFLVQPPENQYEYYNIKVHAIQPSMTSIAPTFDKIWTKIRHLFEETTVVAHNASFDIDKLLGTLRFYGIETPSFEVCCTMCLNNHQGLKDACLENKIELLHHHDALADAEACAKLFLVHLNNKPCERFSSNNEIKEPFSNKIIEKIDLIPNFEVSNKENPFYMKKVVFTGDLNFINRKDAAHALKILGADVNTSISKKTDLVIIGDSPGPTKLEKIQKLQDEGYNIMIINQNDFQDIYNTFCNS